MYTLEQQQKYKSWARDVKGSLRNGKFDLLIELEVDTVSSRIWFIIEAGTTFRWGLKVTCFFSHSVVRRRLYF